MANATQRQCSGPGCSNIVTGPGLCATCKQRKGATRESAARRGYDAHWRAWCAWWSHHLITLGGVLCCGAVHPNGPRTSDSACLSRGILNTRSLQYDHEPPLQPHERSMRSAVCDALRIQVLCIQCHSRKTARERASRGAA